MLGWPYTFVNKYNIQCPQKSVTLEWEPRHSSQQAYEDRIRKKIGTNRCVQKLVNKSKFSKGAHTLPIWQYGQYLTYAHSHMTRAVTIMDHFWRLHLANLKQRGRNSSWQYFYISLGCPQLASDVKVHFKVAKQHDFKCE